MSVYYLYIRYIHIHRYVLQHYLYIYIYIAHYILMRLSTKYDDWMKKREEMYNSNNNHNEIPNVIEILQHVRHRCDDGVGANIST